MEIEVMRWVLGHVDTAGQHGQAEMISAYEDVSGVAHPPRWS